MGHFLSDLERSKEAVILLAKNFESNGYKVRELPREEQNKGDLEITKFDELLNIEIKFDIRAKRSGNLCFEISNGTRMTGIMETKADRIYYVVPDDSNYLVFYFDPEKLRTYLKESSNVTIKNGGDKKKFVLALVKISDIVADNLMKSFFTLD